MARDVEALFHETWLGEAQPLEGLTFSVPVLCDGGVMMRLSAAEAEVFSTVAPADDEGTHRLANLRELLTGFLGWTEGELVVGEALPEDLVLRIAEEGTELRPDAAIARPPAQSDEEVENEATLSGEQTPASRAGQPFQMLLWDVPHGLEFDTAESETSEWHYPPASKFERLLRETRVPMGLLSNGDIVRLFYCPPGHATGWISFPVDYMATPAGRDMLSAFREVLHADRVMGGMPDTPTTLELLERSRDRQADVTTKLGSQLLDGLQILLQGFEAAARRDGDEALRDALEQDGNHVYEGLLTVMLRLVFALAAEDRGLVPAEHPIYATHLSVGGLYDELQADQDLYADTMDQRFGAWARLLVLFRALYFGVEFDGLSMPPHRGRLFNPERFKFLEGEMQVGGASVAPEARAGMRVPSISDAVVLRILRRLLYLDGQRLSYSALEEEQLGSVYEGLMGYAIERRSAPSVCLRPTRVWVSPDELLEQSKATRVRWLKDAGVLDAAAKRIAKAVDDAVKEAGKNTAALHEAVMLILRKESIAPRGKRAARRGDDTEEAEVAAGRLVIQPGEERRRTSTHYTPRSLSGPIVARTLEPLLAAMRARAKEEDPSLEDPQPSSEALLSLKICDPAMGSGAFLVEACRFLAKQVEAAWVREGALAQMVREADDDDVVKRDPLRLAQRMVAQRCLYGVDKNPLAVELGKLSLWLLTLSRGQTFTFLDHCLKAGDSLVGLNKAQLLAMDWTSEDPLSDSEGGSKAGKKKKGKDASEEQMDLFAEQTKRAFAKATVARKKLAELSRSGDQSETEREQRALHIEAEEALERLRDVADVLVSAFFWPYDEAETLSAEFLFDGKKPSDKDRQTCQRRLRDQLNLWLGDAEASRLPLELEQRRKLVRSCIRPMHWHLEFPEIFDEARPDPLALAPRGRVWMDAVVGNPPFMAGRRISGTLGDSYSAWIRAAYQGHLNADLSALFFRRGHWLLGEHGTLGLIATNTIGQGDTRASGLQPVLRQNGRIFAATRAMKWPTAGVGVTVSIVNMAFGTTSKHQPTNSLDGREVPYINSRLNPKPERKDPLPLLANQGRSFQGSVVLGKGFILSPEERALLRRDQRNEARIQPYIGGEEINTSPSLSAHRYIINFQDMSTEEAGQWPLLFQYLEARVKPERKKQKRKHLRDRWWQYADRRPGLYGAIESLSECLVCSVVSKHLAFAFQPTDRVFSHRLVVFPFSGRAPFGVLQSRVHESWARLLSSTLGTTLNYTPTDCFETFPFPPDATLALTGPLEAVAAKLYQARAEFMQLSDQGLTKTYNALKNPEDTTTAVVELRRLHEDLDRAVLDAYEQPHIEVPPYCGADPEQLQQFEDEVLDFLFARNEELAKEEARAQKRAQS